VILVLQAASKKYKQKSVWAKTFIDCAEDLTRIFFMQEQLHFVLLLGFKDINTSEFTQSLA